MNAPDLRQRNRNRNALVLLVAIFFGGLLAAGALRFSGWQPAGHENHGEMLQPAIDLRALTPRLADGGEYQWKPVERRWRILVAPPPGCTDACVASSSASSSS